MGDTIFRALLAWGREGPKLRSFKVDGAMSLSLAVYAEFVRDNQCLAPELEEFVVQYWFANPPLVNSQLIQAITKRYRHLRLLEVGSCCHSVSDDAFKYFRENPEGIQAGLELENLFLVCITQVEGAGWLDVDSVNAHLPKLKKFRIGGGRCFCTCGDARCGQAAPRIARLRDECRLAFEHGAAHW